MRLPRVTWSGRCHSRTQIRQLADMSTAARAKGAMLGQSAGVTLMASPGPSGSALWEFEQVYRGNVAGVMGYFARRCGDPQIVADLTSETFVRAAGAFGGFDPER